MRLPIIALSVFICFITHKQEAFFIVAIFSFIQIILLCYGAFKMREKNISIKYMLSSFILILTFTFFVYFYFRGTGWPLKDTINFSRNDFHYWFSYGGIPWVSSAIHPINRAVLNPSIWIMLVYSAGAFYFVKKKHDLKIICIYFVSLAAFFCMMFPPTATLIARLFSDFVFYRFFYIFMPFIGAAYFIVKTSHSLSSRMLRTLCVVLLI